MFGLFFKTGRHRGPPIYPRGTDIESGFRDWAASEIQSSARIRHDLGKFFFTVSAASFGTLLTLLKLSDQTLGGLAAWSIFLLGVSIIISIRLVIPEHWTLGGKTNLVQRHRMLIASAQRLVVAWVIFWILAVLLGFGGVLNVEG